MLTCLSTGQGPAWRALLVFYRWWFEPGALKKTWAPDILHDLRPSQASKQMAPISVRASALSKQTPFWPLMWLSMRLVRIKHCREPIMTSLSCSSFDWYIQEDRAPWSQHCHSVFGFTTEEWTQEWAPFTLAQVQSAWVTDTDVCTQVSCYILQDLCKEVWLHCSDCGTDSIRILLYSAHSSYCSL